MSRSRNSRAGTDVHAPKLPEIDSPPPEDVLDGVPSTDEIIEQAQPAEEIVQEQPDVEELLGGRDERSRPDQPKRAAD